MVDIIIPYYNTADFILSTVLSIEDQRCSIPYTITIVDDCSKQPLPNGIKAKVITLSENHGPAYARNIGISSCKNPFILCVDSDDMLDPNYIQSCYDIAIKTGADIVYTDFDWLRDNKRLSGGNTKYDIEAMRHNPQLHCSSLYKRSLWEALGGYDESMIYGWEDYDYYLRASQANAKFIKNCNSRLIYRYRYDSRSRDANDNYFSKIRPQLKQKFGDYYLS